MLADECATVPRISLVAVCCSSASASCFCASASSRVRAPTCSCRSARVELATRAAVGALLRRGFVVLPCCVFAGLRLIVRRRLTDPFLWADEHTLPHHGVCCAHSKIRCRSAAMGLGLGRVPEPRWLITVHVDPSGA